MNRLEKFKLIIFRAKIELNIKDLVINIRPATLLYKCF